MGTRKGTNSLRDAFNQRAATPDTKRAGHLKLQCAAQVNGRNAITWEEKFDLDVWYVDNLSLKLDMKIFVLTLIKILKREGINSKGTLTMERFTGSK